MCRAGVNSLHAEAGGAGWGGALRVWVVFIVCFHCGLKSRMCVVGTRMQEVQEASEVNPLVSAAGGASGEAQPWGRILLLHLFSSRPERGISAQLSTSGAVRWVFKDVSPQARSEVPFS